MSAAAETITVTNNPAADGFEFPQAAFAAVYRVEVGTRNYTSRTDTYRLDSTGAVYVWHPAGWTYVATWTQRDIIDSATGPDIIEAAHRMLHGGGAL